MFFFFFFPNDCFDPCISLLLTGQFREMSGNRRQDEREGGHGAAAHVLSVYRTPSLPAELMGAPSLHK